MIFEILDYRNYFAEILAYIPFFSYFCNTITNTMAQEELVRLFDAKQIRVVWDKDTEKYYFSVVDVVQVLTDSIDYQTARNYWKIVKHRLTEEGNETVTNCNRLKLTAADGKKRLTQSKFCGLFSLFRRRKQNRLSCGLPKSDKSGLTNCRTPNGA